MNDENNKSFLIFLGIFILAGVVRFVFDSNPYILNIIAGINIIAFWYICYLILESVQNEFQNRMNESDHLGDNVKTKKKKHFKKHILYYKIIILILGILYVIFLASAIINDIISLCALFLSVETNYISISIQEHFTKKK